MIPIVARTSLLICICCLVKLDCLFAFQTMDCSQDTKEPIFLTPPQNDTINCELELETAFTTWYLNGANAEVFDTMGEASVQALLSLEDALAKINSSQASNCTSGVSESFDFYALDTCGLVSEDTLSAAFVLLDILDPDQSSPPRDTSIICSENSFGEFQGWLNRFADAQLVDNCSPVFFLCQYFYQDNQGNFGFWNEGDDPIFPITRFDCDWIVNITFTYSDGYENNTNSFTSQFSVMDTIAPVFEGVLAPDITISCEEDMPDANNPGFSALDECDGSVDLSVDDSSNQSDDPSECAFYEYIVTRSFTASDACGNSVQHIQNISIIDTLVPSFTIPADLTLYCIAERDTSVTGVPTNLRDNCDSNPQLSFSDTEMEESCGMTISRFWQLDRKSVV